jgi:hypothetical protein
MSQKIDSLKNEKAKLNLSLIDLRNKSGEARTELTKVKGIANFHDENIALLSALETLNKGNETPIENWETDKPKLDSEESTFELAKEIIAFANKTYSTDKNIIKLIDVLKKKMVKEETAMKKVESLQIEVDKKESELNNVEDSILTANLVKGFNTDDEIIQSVKHIFSNKFNGIWFLLACTLIFFIVIFKYQVNSDDVSKIVKQQQIAFEAKVKKQLSSAATGMNNTLKNDYQTKTDADLNYLSKPALGQEYLTITAANDPVNGFAKVKVVSDLDSRVDGVEGKITTLASEQEVAIKGFDTKFDTLKGELKKGFEANVNAIIDPKLDEHVKKSRKYWANMQKQVDANSLSITEVKARQEKIVKTICEPHFFVRFDGLCVKSDELPTVDQSTL